MRGAALGAFTGVLVTAAPVLAQVPPSLPRTARLEYTRGTGAESCPDEQGLRDAVAAQTPRELFSPDAPARLIVAITRSGRRYQGQLELRDSVGAVLWTRAFPPTASCEGLVEDVGIAIRVELVPRLPRAPEAPAVVPPPPPPPSSPALLPPPPTEKPSPLWVRFGVGLGASFAVAPAPAFNLAADVGVRWSFFSASLEGRWAAPAGIDLDGGHLSTSLLGGALVPCGHYRWLFGCGVLALGRLSGEAAAVDHPQVGAAFHAAAGARLGVEFPLLAHFALRVSGEALGTIQPVTFRFEGQPRWATRSVSGGLAAGPLFFF